MTRPHYLNGRVLLRPGLGGVQRYAREMAARIDDLTVVSPHSARHPWSARLWEQTRLHRASVDGVLMSLAHAGPARHPRHLVAVHDLFALRAPRCVNPAFAVHQRIQLPLLIRNAAVVASPSHRVASEIVESFGIPRSRVRVVPPGIADVFAPGDRAAAKTELGLDAGRLAIGALLDPTPRKQAGSLVRLLDELGELRSNVDLVVAGQTLAAPVARSLRRGDIERPRRAVDLGAAEDRRLATLYRAVDVFVELSPAEGFGLPAVEAAWSGAAVVTTPVPSVVEHCPDAVVRVDGPTAARSAVLELLDSPGRRVELAARAAEQLAELRWDVTAATLDELMDTIGR